MYHEGKYADARNVLYERGWQYELQPGWNVTTTPLGGGAGDTLRLTGSGFGVTTSDNAVLVGAFLRGP